MDLKTTHNTMDNKEIQDTLRLMTSDQADQRHLGWALLYSQHTQDELITFFEWVEEAAIKYDSVSETLRFVISGEIPRDKTLRLFKTRFRASCTQGGLINDRYNPLEEYRNKYCKSININTNDDTGADLSKVICLEHLNVNNHNECIYTTPKSKVERLTIRGEDTLSKIDLDYFDSLKEVSITAYIGGDDILLTQEHMDKLSKLKCKKLYFRFCNIPLLSSDVIFDISKNEHIKIISFNHCRGGIDLRYLIGGSPKKIYRKHPKHVYFEGCSMDIFNEGDFKRAGNIIDTRKW